MLEFLLILSICFPVLAGGVVFLDENNVFLKRIVCITGTVLALSALFLAFKVPSVVTFGSGLAEFLQKPIIILDLALLCVILYIGWKRKHYLIRMLAAIQLVGVLILEIGMHPQVEATTPAFTIDSLAVTLVLVVSTIGSLIAYYAIDYMREHEHHLHLAKTRQPRFFAVILVFLGAMNGLALSDDLTWVYFFWEVTTLCSFLLISHDDTEIANANAARALWMNMLGGVGFVFALLFLQQSTGTLSLTALKEIAQGQDARSTIILLPVVALCFAGFTKAAQAPFQSWLCGAMVAPTPVSALLHSSTMVKAGVYLILRLAPLYAGTTLSIAIALFGAFTFFCMAALGAGQSNGKKILAYSTIVNLALIITCAGINTPGAIAAGIMLLVFHALSKGLLFLCVGHIEQTIGSRDIEDMRSLYTLMSRTTLILTLGVLSMTLPPFGVLLAKWMVLEASVSLTVVMPIVVGLLALGSALTILYLSRWAGIMLGSVNPRLEIAPPKERTTVRRSLKIMAVAVLVLSFFAPAIYVWLVEPAVFNMFPTESSLFYKAEWGGLGNSYGVFAVYPLYIIIGIGFWYAWRLTKNTPVNYSVTPYLSGVQSKQNDITGFTGPMKQFVATKSSNYYLSYLFAEDKITRPINLVAITLLVMLLGGVLK